MEPPYWVSTKEISEIGGAPYWVGTTEISEIGGTAILGKHNRYIGDRLSCHIVYFQEGYLR